MSTHCGVQTQYEINTGRALLVRYVGWTRLD
jgi:hypothetical protein